jgi:hypothetical protein
MHPMKLKQYSISFFDWEISLTLLWSKLKYLIFFKIGRDQGFAWSASIEVDCDPHENVDAENLAETFIGKLFSEEPNQEEQNQTD